MTLGTVVLVGVLVVLVGLLFVLAAIEASLLHVRRSAVASHDRADDPATLRLLRLLDALPAVMNSVLLAVLLAQVTATTVAGLLARRWLGGSAATVATLGVAVVLFVYGEAIPKTIAIADPLRHARRFSRLTVVLYRALQPVVAVLVKIASLQSPGIGRIDTAGAVSERELLHLTGEAAAAGEIDLSDAELIRKSFSLGDLTVGDHCIPAAEVVAVDADTSVANALRIAIAAGHRRLVVHHALPGNVDGFVRLRDLAHQASFDEQAPTGPLARPALFLDRSTLLIGALRSMQQHRCHLAIVTDVSGADLGIVTIEDIAEVLLGEIDEPSTATRPATPSVGTPHLGDR
ncbi:MAG: CNNM domain-containing protein [Acidimicrobiales bacterium]